MCIACTIDNLKKEGVTKAIGREYSYLEYDCPNVDRFKVNPGVRLNGKELIQNDYSWYVSKCKLCGKNHVISKR